MHKNKIKQSPPKQNKTEFSMKASHLGRIIRAVLSVVFIAKNIPKWIYVIITFLGTLILFSVLKLNIYNDNFN